MALPETVTTPQLAQLLGMSERQVREFASQGIIVRRGRSDYDLKASVSAYAAHLREIAAGRGGGAIQATLATQRARLAQEKADAEAMKNARLRGDVIDAKEVERTWCEILRDVRSRLLAVPNRMQQRLAHLGAEDVREIDVEIRQALEALSHD